MKTGRKKRHHVTADGQTIVGLTRRPDGRWRVIGTHQTFREDDETKAIEKFRSLSNARLSANIAGHQLDGTRSEFVDLRAMLDSAIEQNEKQFWGYVAERIHRTPAYVAQMTGIEWIEYGPKLKRPSDLPSFEQIESAWREHSRCSAEQRRRVLHNWKHFVTHTKITGLPDITPEVCITYRDTVYAMGLTGKGQHNLFSRIRRMLSFAKSRAMAMAECTRALESLSLLVPSDTATTINPMPIEPAEFQSLLKASEKTPEVKAMLLVALNAGMYLQEVCNLDWSDIANGCIVTHRKKTGKRVRVACLWAETIEALNKLPKREGCPFIFGSNLGQRLGVKGAEKRWRKLRKDAGCPHVVSSQLRDGAATAAAAANVNSQLVSLLLGHSCGMKDFYCKRNPEMVKPATDAVYAKYFTANNL